jgi:hypothetical protein
MVVVKNKSQRVIERLNEKVEEQLRFKNAFFEAKSKKRKLSEIEQINKTDNKHNGSNFIESLENDLLFYKNMKEYLEKKYTQLKISVRDYLTKRGFEKGLYLKRYDTQSIVRNFKGDYSLNNTLSKLEYKVEYKMYLPVDDDDIEQGHYVVSFFLSKDTDSGVNKFNIKIFATETTGFGKGEKSMRNLQKICKDHGFVIYVYEVVEVAVDFWVKMKRMKIIKDFSFFEEHIEDNLFEIRSLDNLVLDYDKYKYSDGPAKMELFDNNEDENVNEKHIDEETEEDIPKINQGFDFNRY